METNDTPCWTGANSAESARTHRRNLARIQFYPGWPLRCAHVVVPGLRTGIASGTPSASRGPSDMLLSAQINGRELQGTLGPTTSGPPQPRTVSTRDGPRHSIWYCLYDG